MLKAIIFDYNGILVDDLAYHRDAYIRVAEELGYTLTPEAVWKYISATPDEKRFLFGDISDETWEKINGGVSQGIRLFTRSVYNINYMSRQYRLQEILDQKIQYLTQNY